MTLFYQPVPNPTGWSFCGKASFSPVGVFAQPLEQVD